MEISCPIFYSNNSFQFKNTLEINYIDKNSNKTPSKKLITSIRFTDATCTANQQSTLPTTSRAAIQRSYSPSDTRAAISTQISIPTSIAPSSNVSTPLKPSPQIPTFDHIVNKKFSKSLIAYQTSKDAVLKEVRDCILTNNESCQKEFNPYIHFHWRDLDVRSGCVCIDEKVAIPNVLREALIEDIHTSQPGIWGMIYMATHCWWPYFNRELIVKATECKPCTVIGKNLKSVNPAKQFRPHVPCVEPNQEIQIVFGAPIFDEKGSEIYF